MWHDTKTLSICLVSSSHSDRFFCAVFPRTKHKGELPELLFNSAKAPIGERTRSLEKWQSFLREEYGVELPQVFLKKLTKKERGLKHWIYVGETKAGKSLKPNI